MFMQWGLRPNITINIKIIIIINRHLPISVRSKIRDITDGHFLQTNKKIFKITSKQYKLIELKLFSN